MNETPAAKRPTAMDIGGAMHKALLDNPNPDAWAAYMADLEAKADQRDRHDPRRGG